MKQGSQGAGHQLPPFAQLWEQLCPAEDGVVSVFLQLGRVRLCGVPGLVPHGWRSQPSLWEPRVWLDVKHGHGTERHREIELKPTAVGTSGLMVSLGGCTGLDWLRKIGRASQAESKKGMSVYNEAAGGSVKARLGSVPGYLRVPRSDLLS